MKAGLMVTLSIQWIVIGSGKKVTALHINCRARIKILTYYPAEYSRGNTQTPNKLSFLGSAKPKSVAPNSMAPLSNS